LSGSRRPALPPLALAAAVVGLLTPAAAPADELIQIPTADRVVGPKVEYLHRAEGRAEGYGTVFFPAGLSYELMFRYYKNFDRRHRVEGGAQMQLLPDGIVTPGVALGIWDVTNSSPMGRRAFLVLTKSLEAGQLGVPKPFQRVQLNVGVGTGRFGGPLAGIRADLPAGFSLVGEYDARRLNFGLWFNPVPAFSLRGELQNGNPFVGAELHASF
jgi:hypothetical protein